MAGSSGASLVQDIAVYGAHGESDHGDDWAAHATIPAWRDRGVNDDLECTQAAVSVHGLIFSRSSASLSSATSVSWAAWARSQ